MSHIYSDRTEAPSKKNQSAMQSTRNVASNFTTGDLLATQPMNTRLTQSEHIELDRLATIANTLPPHPFESRIVQSSASMPSEGVDEPFTNIASGLGSGASQHTFISNEDGDPNDAHGTLLLSREGRSKYLGPTAGSEWLKDVQ